MTSRLRTLSGRLTAATCGVALVVALVSAVAAWQLVRDVAQDQARQEVSRQVEAIAASPRLREGLERREQILLGPGPTTVTYVDPRGRVSESSDLPAQLIDAVASGETVSRTIDTADGSQLVEGRPTRAGGGVLVTLRLDPVSAATRGLLLRLLIALGAGLSLAIMIAVLLSRHLTRPLTATARTARRLAGGERGLPIAVQGVAELDDVGRALSSLDLALLRSEARQREFLLSVSHEMRTPLTAIQGYADALADGIVEPSEITGVGETLSRESRRLDHFVADLLLLARLEAEDFPIQPGPVDLVDLVGQCVSAWSGRAHLAAVSIHIEILSAPATVWTDPGRARQVLDGLVENALRATPAGGHVHLQVHQWPDHAEVHVVDTGPGLDDSDLATALDRGTLHARYRTSRPVGTGLGLSIAARLTSRLGGRLTPRPAPVGARFVLELPTTGSAQVDDVLHPR